MSAPELTERDRLVLATVLRAIVAREIVTRGIADTYAPAALTVSAYDLIEFADEMLHACDGDNVELATRVVAEIHETTQEHDLDDDDRAQDVQGLMEPLPVLHRLDTAHPLDIQRLQDKWRSS